MTDTQMQANGSVETTDKGIRLPGADQDIAVRAEASVDVEAPGVYDSSWPEETLKMAYELSVKAHGVSVDAIGSLDTKVVTLCTVATALLGLSGTVLKPGVSLISAGAWAIAAGLWALALGKGLATLRARDVEVSNPAKLNDARWLAQPPDAYRFYVIRDLGAAFELNRAVAEEKARGLLLTLRFVGGEVLALALASLLAHL